MKMKYDSYKTVVAQQQNGDWFITTVGCRGPEEDGDWHIDEDLIEEHKDNPVMGCRTVDTEDRPEALIALGEALMGDAGTCVQVGVIGRILTGIKDELANHPQYQVRIMRMVIKEMTK
jgi:hypothetical protein